MAPLKREKYDSILRLCAHNADDIIIGDFKLRFGENAIHDVIIIFDPEIDK